MAKYDERMNYWCKEFREERRAMVRWRVSAIIFCAMWLVSVAILMVKVIQ